jgi:hypothetical protein
VQRLLPRIAGNRAARMRDYRRSAGVDLSRPIVVARTACSRRRAADSLASDVSPEVPPSGSPTGRDCYQSTAKACRGRPAARRGHRGIHYGCACGGLGTSGAGSEISQQVPVYLFCFLQVPLRRTSGSKVAMSHVLAVIFAPEQTKLRWAGNSAEQPVAEPVWRA